MIVVTGATGHLGQWVVARLTDLGSEVLCVARQPKRLPTIEGLAWSRPVRILACDLARRSSVAEIKSALLGAEAVVHLAATVPGDTARNTDADATATLRGNVVATVNLLQFLSASTRLRSFVYASSFEVYGRPLGLPIEESHPTNPVTFYGASKLGAEHYIRLFGVDREVSCCSLRMPAIYGPGESISRALPNFIRAAAVDDDLVLQGDGNDLRDMVYVADAAEAAASAIEKQAIGAVNLGSGRGYSIREMAEAVCRVSGGSSSIIRRPRVKERVDYVLSIDRAREELGWEPRTSLEDGIRSQLAWVREASAG